MPPKIVTAPSRFQPFEWASNGNSLSGNGVVSFQGEIESIIIDEQYFIVSYNDNYRLYSGNK